MHPRVLRTKLGSNKACQQDDYYDKLMIDFVHPNEICFSYLACADPLCCDELFYMVTEAEMYSNSTANIKQSDLFRHISTSFVTTYNKFKSLSSLYHDINEVMTDNPQQAYPLIRHFTFLYIFSLNVNSENRDAGHFDLIKQLSS